MVRTVAWSRYICKAGYTSHEQAAAGRMKREKAGVSTYARQAWDLGRRHFNLDGFPIFYGMVFICG